MKQVATNKEFRVKHGLIVEGNAVITGGLTGNADTASALANARNIALSGDVSGSGVFDGSSNLTISTTLQNTGVTPGTFNRFTVNSKGLITAASNVAESDTLQTVTGRGATTSVALAITNSTTSTSTSTGALRVTGGVGIGNNLHVGGSSRLYGNAVIDGDLTVSGASTTINSDAVYVGGDGFFSGSLSIDGDLTVSGTTVTINTTNLSVEDNMIYLNDGSTTANPDLGFAGNYNDGTYAHAGLFRDASDGVWKFYHGYTLEPDASAFINTTHPSFTLSIVEANKFIASEFQGTLTGNAETASSLASARNISLSGDATGSASFNGTTNVTISTTLANTGVTPGTFNSFTVNSKGLITAASNQPAGATLSDDTTTDASYYLGMSSGTSGAWTSAYVSSSKLYFNPSTGQLNASNFNSLSDRNLKTNVVNISNAENIISLLQGVSYDWVDGSGSGYGFIAQDIEKILQHSVSTNEHGIKTVNYSSVIPFLVEAVKTLQEKVKQLEAK